MNVHPEPFDHADYPPIAKSAPAISRKEKGGSGNGKKSSDSFSSSDQLELGKGSLIGLSTIAVLAPTGVKAPIAVIEKLWLVENDDHKNRSQSFNDRTDFDVPIRADKHFCFVPGLDEVSLAWEVKNAENMGELKLQLYSSHIKLPIWTLEIGGEEATEFLTDTKSCQDNDFTGSFDMKQIRIGKFSSDETDTSFPDGCPTLEHAPYQIRMTITSRDRKTTTIAWTYFDVQVHSIDLFWGPSSAIPPGNRADIEPHFQASTQAQEKAILRALKGVTPDALDGDDMKDLVVTTGTAHNIDLVFNNFSRTLSEWKDNTLFFRHREQWGDGPRIPIFAKIFLKCVDGEGIRSDKSALAIGNTKFLWDWKSRTVDFDRFTNPATKAFVTQTLNYKLNETGVSPPGSMNCHRDRGGKRGPGTTVFPPQSKNDPAQNPTGPFPFKVEPCQKRKWAAFSYARTTGPYAAYTGVLFQPGRMADDTFRLTVFLASELDAQHKPILDIEVDAQALRGQNKKLPHKSTEYFEIHRKIRACHIKKHQNIPDLDLQATNRYFEQAGVVIEWVPAPRNYMTSIEYNALVNDVLTNVRGWNSPQVVDTEDRDYRIDRLDEAVTYVDPTIDHYTGLPPNVNGITPACDWMMTYKSWDEAFRPIRIDVITKFLTNNGEIDEDIVANQTWDEYRKPDLLKVLNAYIAQDRKINDKKRKFRNLKENHPLETNDQIRMRLYTGGLSTNEKKKVDKLCRERMKRKRRPWTPEQYQVFIDFCLLKNLPLAVDEAKFQLLDQLTVDDQRQMRENIQKGITLQGNTLPTNEADYLKWSKWLRRSADLVQEIHQRFLTTNVFEGIFFFHSHSMHAIETSAGDFQDDYGTRGVGPDDISVDNGKKSAYFVFTPITYSQEKLTLWQAGNNVGARQPMTAADVAAHEFGHGNYLPHSPTDRSPTVSGPQDHIHTKDDVRCLMNYDEDDKHLCGACILRMRGWAMFPYANEQIVGFTIDGSKNSA